MKAVVLVGGEGTRLRPLTYSAPKQMLPVVCRPMIERVVAHLAGHGVDHAVLSLGYKPDAFIDAYPDNRILGVEVSYAVEASPLDTAGAIAFAADAAGVDSTFVVVNGDVLTDLDISALVAFHRDRGGEGTIALTPVEDPSAFGVVPTDADGRVTAFIEKPPRDEAPTNYINAGTYVLEPAALGRIPLGEKVSIERVTFPAMVADGALYAMGSEAYWLDAGTPDAYLAANLDLVSGRRGGVPVPGGSLAPELGQGVWTTGTPAVDLTGDGPRLSTCVLDDGAAVESGAVVERAVIGAGATVEAGATVRDAVVFAGARVAAGATVEGSIVGERAVVGQRAVLRPTSVLGAEVVVASGTLVDGERIRSGD